MRGKKVDTDFISTFINEACLQGKNTPEEIVVYAQQKINDIDIKIIEAEKLKKERSKLMDVSIVFKRNKRKENRLDEVLLNFYLIKDKNIAASILSKVFQCSNMEQVKNICSSEDEKFCIKQLLEFKIIQRFGDVIIAAEHYQDFKNFLKENYEIS